MAVVAKPTPRSLNKLIGQKGFRRVRLVRWKKVEKGMKQSGLESELGAFLREGFSATTFKAPDAFWKNLGAGYFFQISIERGELLRLLNREQRIEMTLRGALLQTACRSVIWQAESVCRAVVRNPADQQELLEQGVAALLDLLPLETRGPAPKEANW